MIKEELRKEIEKEAKRRTKGFRNQENCIQSYIMGALDFIEKATNNPETNLNLSEDKKRRIKCINKEISTLQQTQEIL